MKLFKYLIYIFLILLLSNTCDIFKNPEEPDTTPPIVTIISHQDGDFVFELTTIKVEATDNDKVVQVRFAINGIFEFIDEELPWEYEWNTTNYPDSDTIPVELRVVAYDESDNVTISNSINVFISLKYLLKNY